MLTEIFSTFVKDEMRHSHVAQMLADHYDVHRYRVYRPSRTLDKFYPHFIDAIRHLSDDVANAYITSGELILDVALLRSIDDFVDDPLSSQAMALINRDESRHIAVDYHMVEHYASPAYRRMVQSAPKKPLAERVAGARAFAAMTLYGRPFFRDVFFGPMDKVDPSGRRIREAFKRMQLLGAKPGLDVLPIMKFWLTLMDLYHRPWMGPRGKELLARVMGAEPRFMERLATEEELARARAMTFEELAEEALSAKRAD